MAAILSNYSFILKKAAGEPLAYYWDLVRVYTEMETVRIKRLAQPQFSYYLNVYA